MGFTTLFRSSSIKQTESGNNDEIVLELWRLNRALDLQKVGEKYRQEFAQQPPPPPNEAPPRPPANPFVDPIKKIRRTSSFDSTSSSLSSLSFDDEPRTPLPSAAHTSFLSVPSSSDNGLIPISISPSIQRNGYSPPRDHRDPFRPQHRFAKADAYTWHPSSPFHTTPECPHPHLITFSNLSLYHHHIYTILNTIEMDPDHPTLKKVYHHGARLLHKPFTRFMYERDHERCRYYPATWAIEHSSGRVGECLFSDGTVLTIMKECWEFIRLCEAYLGEHGQGQKKVGYGGGVVGLQGEGDEREKRKEERWLVAWWRRDVEGVCRHLEESLWGGLDGQVVQFRRLPGVFPEDD
ncbi:hypothetical protein BJ508DRAFT_148602 [Ascobolus immersus RN42]|uniref:Uncharacterized protein n=1 Tax=Ascobolus immersus RN42 TaxID=1160509 RepID=A0A3N4ILG8_ASCIM|nr:hypothetical protein BJ508DRAFT_148602 [Ascobolus immersus RN42]